MKPFKIIGAGLGVGGANHQSNDAPDFQYSAALKQLKSAGISYDWLKTIDERSFFEKPIKSLNVAERLEVVHQVNTELARLTHQQVKNHQRFCVIGGDHSCAIGTWSGAASVLEGDLGLIWVDAHMDAHTFETTPTQNMHGMPVAALLGFGHEKLTHILTKFPKLKPENLCLIGIRSFENEESLLLKNLGVTVYTQKEVEQLGLETVLVRAHEQVTRNTTGFGFSIDLDGFDPEYAPGTGTPVATGINAHDFCRIISRWSNDSKLIGFEIAEFNPHLEKDKITENTMAEIIRAFQS
ncbi:MAG: arginase [Pseudomonadota bacterium]